MKVISKYDVGDTVWYMSNNKVQHSIVEGVHIHLRRGVVMEYVTEVNYSLECIADMYNQSNLYPTKEDLLLSL